MNNELTSTILNLWQISRTALQGLQNVPTRYDRMQYVKQQLNKDYQHLITRLTPKYVWYAIEDAIN